MFVRTIDPLERRFRERLGRSPHQRRLTFSERGLTLGAEALIARALLRRGAPVALATQGEETILLAKLSAAFGTRVRETVVARIERAYEHFVQGDGCLAHIALAQLGLPEIDEDGAFRLFLSEDALARGATPRAVFKALGLDWGDSFGKYDPDQPCDEDGRWTADGGSGVIEGRSVSPGGPHGGDDSEDDKLEDFKSKFEEDSPQEDLEHGRPIDPMQTPFGAAPGASNVRAPGMAPSNTEFLGINPQNGGARWNTDLPGGREEATDVFNQFIGGQNVRTAIGPNGVKRTIADDGTQLRVNPDGAARIDRPVAINGKNRETVHFNLKK